MLKKAPSFLFIFCCLLFITGFGQTGSKKSGDVLRYATAIVDTSKINEWAKAAELLTAKGELEKALQTSIDILQQSKKINYKKGVARGYTIAGDIYYRKGSYNLAEKNLLASFALSQEINAEELTKQITELLSAVYEKKGNYPQAYAFYKLFSIAKDTLLNQENSKLIKQMNAKYTTEKKGKEIELLKKNEDIQNLELIKKKAQLSKQRAVSIGVFLAFILIMIVAILMFSRYRLKKKANEKLQIAFTLIEEKNKEIEKTNELITDSITYAKRIQDAILPATEDFAKALPGDFFVFYQPAHIVSGDFYWCSTHNNKTIFVIADCSGHGVPGAFMSMIGNTLLNEIVNVQKITDTKRIAHLLDQKIIDVLHQHADSDQYDGMNISICCIDKEKEQITFTGGRHNMYVMNGKLEEIKGNPYSIGDTTLGDAKQFTSQTIGYKNGLRLYFFTDGYCDQCGGSENKRFSSKQFEALIKEISLLPMEEQNKKLKLSFESWKGETDQHDDVLVVGVAC